MAETLTPLPLKAWLPTTKDEMEARGWDFVDVVLVTGDSYVDHPAFANAMIARTIEKAGYRVAICAQPNWRDDLRDFKKLGKPRLCFAVSAGNMDSMVNHYTAGKRLRSDDAYTAGGQAGYRPDYASVVYTQTLKNLFPDVPVVLGGIEASMRRFVHYDYWSDTLKPSILIESGADILVYGMGERAIVDILAHWAKTNPGEANHIPQTAWKCYPNDSSGFVRTKGAVELPSWHDCKKSPEIFAKGFQTIETESNKMNPRQIIQSHDDCVLVVNPPYPIATTGELDELYHLPFTRLPHPRYRKRGTIPAYEMIRHSIQIHRGCFGGCAFCTLAAHQGKFISSRSVASIAKEAMDVTKMPDFKGHITDLGGPSANMYCLRGIDQALCAKCKRPSCLFPKECTNLNTNHQPLIELYRRVAALDGVKKVTIGSGVRYDMLVQAGKNPAEHNSHVEYARQLITHHVSGRLKVAPEHTSDRVLQIMRKPSYKLFHAFNRQFEEINRQAGLKQQLIPYFISSHPGSRVADMAHLAAETKSQGFHLEQIQDFTPTPMTLASVIYYSGIHPFTGKKVYTARHQHEKSEQRMFFFWYKAENKPLIRKKLAEIGEQHLADLLVGKAFSGHKKTAPPLNPRFKHKR